MEPAEMTRLALLALVVAVVSCTRVASVDCVVQPIWLDDGFETRLTEDEKRQVLALNEWLEQQCGAKP